MTVLLTVLLKFIFKKHSIHAAHRMICDSGPGTIVNKAGSFHKLSAFLLGWTI